MRTFISCAQTKGSGRVGFGPSRHCAGCGVELILDFFLSQSSRCLSFTARALSHADRKRLQPTTLMKRQQEGFTGELLEQKRRSSSPRRTADCSAVALRVGGFQSESGAIVGRAPDRMTLHHSSTPPPPPPSSSPVFLLISC